MHLHFPPWATAADIHATLLPLNLIRSIVRPVKLNWIEKRPKPWGWTFVFFVRRMRVNNYDEDECCQNFKGRRGCTSVLVLAVCYFFYAPVHLKHISKGSFQYSQYCEAEDFLFQPPSFHHTSSHRYWRRWILEEEKKKKWRLGYLLEMVSCQQKGNGISISKVHSGTCLEKTSSKWTIWILQDSLPLRA